MTPCMVSTGFFVLGRCGRASVTGCAGCGRPVCDRHVSGDRLCPECATARGYGSPYDPMWSYGYRRETYYTTSSSYQDPGLYGDFDAYDRGAFDPGDQGDFGEPGDFDDGDDRDFGDS
ncbi:hypothetical protein [Nonomuraea rhizosphaerae]|uniref:hypothetical protein n=1 Tax=Nonomuraea rhizosphaerae TaxID=2665663 RepID=UPI001C5DFB73|nr:hypothetical protein [Nonomuraea rhizosphaerae]